MGIGRYFMTVIIATFASSLVYFVVRDLPEFFALLQQGDPAVAAGYLSQALVAFLLGSVGLAVVGYLAWRFISLLYLRPARGAQPLMTYVLSGIMTHALLFMLATALYALGSVELDLRGNTLAAVAALVAGSAWGTVFWFMDPRAHKDKSIAEDFA